MKVLNERQVGLVDFLENQINSIDKELAKLRNNIKVLTTIKTKYQEIRKEIK